MSFILLQNPASPLAAKLETLMQWQGIYYQPHHLALSQEPLVALWDCHLFAPQLIKQWQLPATCLLLAWLATDSELDNIKNMDKLFMLLPSASSMDVVCVNLWIAQKSGQQQLSLQKNLSQAQRQIEELGLIGQAKRWLMRHWSFSEDQAHRWLQLQSQAQQQTLLHTARKIMQGYYLGSALQQAQTIVKSDKPEE